MAASVPLASAELVSLIKYGRRSLLRIPIDREEFNIGRHASSDVPVPDPSVPPLAAILISAGEGRFQLRDLSEGTAVSVEGKAFDGGELEIAFGDIIHVGLFDFQLRPQRSEAEPERRQTSAITVEPVPDRDAFLVYQDAIHTVLRDKGFRVGSGEDNDLVINQEFVSRDHLRISMKGGRWLLTDLASRNGTRVNGLLVPQCELPPDAVIQVGSEMLLFKMGMDVKKPHPEAQLRYGMVAESPEMRRLVRRVEQLAEKTKPVLIIGESGSGKELVARALHDASPRKDKPFLALNCGGLTASVIAGELFGHERGSFTGAVEEKAGAFEFTDGGTIFLDEIGELPLELQTTLLRVIESNAIRRVGGNAEIPINTRIVAATHRNLAEAVEQGAFRGDLFQRLETYPLVVPPLRKRPADVVALARHFLKVGAPEHDLVLSGEVEQLLKKHDWPWNARELRNVMERAILNANGAPTIQPEHLEFSGESFKPSNELRSRVLKMDRDERSQIIEALELHAWNKTHAAAELGIKRTTLLDRIKRHGIQQKPVSS
jgi:DNA-binding NtrC family response regulator